MEPAGKYKKWISREVVQYCGKDNLRYQAATWQAMLMSAGIGNSTNIIINGFITGEGGVKMSKSLGNTVDPKDIVENYGVDALRYFLLKKFRVLKIVPLPWRDLKMLILDL
ncbi:MAG: class I tRNA ligase family protein [Candidatus Paceibacterota bacterium]